MLYLLHSATTFLLVVFWLSTYKINGLKNELSLIDPLIFCTNFRIFILLLQESLSVFSIFFNLMVIKIFFYLANILMTLCLDPLRQQVLWSMQANEIYNFWPFLLSKVNISFLKDPIEWHQTWQQKGLAYSCRLQ